MYWASLPKDAWGCLRYILKYVHLLRRGTTELVKEYVKGEESRMVPPMLNNYMRVARLVCTIRPKLWVVMKELGYAHEDERRTLMECRINGALRHALVHYESAGMSARSFGDQKRLSLTNSARSGLVFCVSSVHSASPAFRTPLDPSRRCASYNPHTSCAAIHLNDRRMRRTSRFAYATHSGPSYPAKWWMESGEPSHL